MKYISSIHTTHIKNNMYVIQNLIYVLKYTHDGVSKGVASFALMMNNGNNIEKMHPLKQ